MTNVQIKLSLPDALAREAGERGLLDPEAVERLIREEVRRNHVDRLFHAADRLASLPGPSLTEEELTTEIEAARRARRNADPGGR